MNKTVLQKWCDQAWLHVLYLLGIVAWCALFVGWSSWSVPQRLVCLLVAMIPLHVFEENHLPGGFFFMNNIGQKSENPRMYPQNMFTNMYTNLGAEILVCILFFFVPKIEVIAVTVVIFFGIGEVAHHTMDGYHMYQRYHEVGKRTLYGPGTIHSYVALLPMSVYGIYYLSQNSFEWSDVIIGIVAMVVFIACFILLPFQISKRVKSEKYAFTDIGYFDKYEKLLNNK